MASSMMASKSRTGLHETSTSSTTHKHPIHATSKVAKLIRGGSTKGPSRDPSPSQNAAASVIGEKSMSMSMDSKINTGERRSIKITPRLSTPSSEKGSRPLKLSELQEQVTVAQDDLKKAKNKLEEVEKEKAEAIEELKDAKKMVEEANEKLEDALSAKRRAEEAWEIEKFRAIELEQTSIESIQRKEEEWRKKLEITQKQHSQDIAALVLTNKELEKARAELARAVEARCAALNRAEEASKMAEDNERKLEALNGEIERVKGLLDVEVESKAKEVLRIAAENDKKVEAIAVSRDHKPDQTDERQRIEEAGGFVMWAGTWRVGGVLAVSRAFGDKLLKQYVVVDPEIREEVIDNSLEFLILASDGLWDVVSNEEAVQMVRPVADPEQAAKMLLEEAYKRESSDNITCVVVRFISSQNSSSTG